MKKHIASMFALALAICCTTTLNAQKYAFVDTQYILDNISEYKAARQQLDQVSINWQKEIESKYAVIDKLYKDYQAEQILLTTEMKNKREAEITIKEKEVKEFQKQKFGFEGELFKKKQELVKPIQDKIFNAVKKLATDQSYAVIFDKSTENLTMLYTNPKYDKSDEILLSMGYKAGTKTGGGNGGGEKGGSSTGGKSGGSAEPPRESNPRSEEGNKK